MENCFNENRGKKKREKCASQMASKKNSYVP